MWPQLFASVPQRRLPRGQGFWAASLLLFVLLCLLAGAVESTPARRWVIGYRTDLLPSPGWQDELARRLRADMPGHELVFKALTADEEAAAAANKTVDVLFTDAVGYVTLHERTGAVTPLGSWHQSDAPLHGSGAAIVVRADRSDLDSLASLRYRRIAHGAGDRSALWLAPLAAFDQAGVPRQDLHLLKLPGGDAAVLDAVLNAQVDAGVVPVGALEALEEAKGRQQLRVLAPRTSVGLMVALSTPVYPGPVMLALGHVDAQGLRLLARALLSWHDHGHEDSEHGGAAHDPPSAVTHSHGSHADADPWTGFAVTDDLTGVAQSLEALRLPPFDAPVRIDWVDFWQEHRAVLSAAIVAAVALVVLTMQLAISNRRLRQSRAAERQAAHDLKSERNHLNAVLNTLPYRIWLKDRQGVWCQANEALLHMMNRRREDVLGKRDSELFSAEHAALYQAQDLQVLQHGARIDVEEWVTTGQGHRELLALSKVPLRDADGAIVGVLGVAYDVTHIRNSEARAVQAHERLASVLRAIPDLMFEFDAQGRYVDVWARDASQLAAPRERLLGQRVDDVLPPEVAATIHQALATARSEGQVSGHRIALPLGHGNSYFELSTARLQGGHCIVLSRDVTARVQLEIDLRGITDHAAEGIWTTNSAGRFLFANPAACTISGHSLAELQGMRIQDLADEREWPRVRQHMKMLRQAGQVSVGEWWLRHRDGHLVPVELSTQMLPDGRFLAMGRDVSQHRQQQETLRRAARVFASAAEGIMVTDADTVILDVNPAFTSITGYSRDEAVGNKPKMLSSGRQDQAFYQDMMRTLAEQGFWRGEVWNRRKSGEVYAEMLAISAVRDERGRITEYVGVFSDINAIKQHEEELHRIAYYDVLTGLPNRRLLADRLQQALSRAAREGSLCAVCYIDLDGFKPVNDRFGHAVGDQLLLQVAQRLSMGLRAGDTLARIGGDEFVLVIGALDRVESCYPALQRMLDVVAQPVRLHNESVQVTASIGVTLFPIDARDGDTLMRHADQAMYHAKELGKNRYYVFDAEQDRQRGAKRDALAQLAAAFQRNEFELFYQPKVDLRTGAVEGAEALIRWRQTDGSLVPPSDFLPLMDDNPLEIAVSEWVVETALKQSVAWRRMGLPQAISVNIVAAHLEQAHFIDWMAQLLQRYPEVQPGDLQLEVLESVALDNLEATAAVLSQLRRLGVEWALDDFGTGYSSLAYFRRLPVDVLKIDQGFVLDMLADPEDLGIVENVIRLASAFNRKVIAEGVETPEHWRLLLALGCPLGQGYGIARPMPAAEFPGWVARWQEERRWDVVLSAGVERSVVELSVAEAFHRRWLERLKRGLLALSAEDVRHCISDRSFGTWLRGSGRLQYGSLLPFAQIEKLHETLQSLAEQMADSLARGQPAEASGLLTELEATAAQLQQGMAAMRELGARLDALT